MSANIKVSVLDVYSSNADAIVIPFFAGSSAVDGIAAKLKEHWRIDLVVPKLAPGDHLIVPITQTDRQNNLNPRNFLIFACLQRSSSGAIGGLMALLPSIAKLSKENPLIREFGLAMYKLGLTETDLKDFYEALNSNFFPSSATDCKVELCFLDQQEASTMDRLISQESVNSELRVELQRKYSVASRSDVISAVNFYILRGFADRGREIIDPAVSVLSAQDDQLTRELFLIVQVGSLIFLSANVADSVDFLPVSAIGEVKENNDGKLRIVWFSEGFSSQVKNRNYPLRSIIEVELKYEKKELFALLKESSFSKFVKPIFVPSPNQQRREGRNTDFSNDYEIGEDYLDIADDVDAFARIVALRDLRPPLAIALCGKWGAGKSFFMGKMIEKMQSLSAQESDVFCKGMLHVQFNAWSYLDSNLWAGLVTRIFNGINTYINDFIESDQLREKLKQELQEKLSLSQQSVFKMEAEKNTLSSKIATLEERKQQLDTSLKQEVSNLRNRSYKEFFATVMREFGTEKKISKALRANGSASEVSKYIEKHFPDELWADGKWMKKEVSWWRAFFLDFFSKKRLFWNIPVVLIITLLIYWFPHLLDGLVSFITRTEIHWPQQFWLWLTVMGTLSTKAVKSYRKIQPLFAAMWNVRKQHAEKVDETERLWEQQAMAIKEQIDIDKEKITQLEGGITAANLELTKVEFRLLNRLNTEAFQGFVKDKSGNDGYRKHQGIVATIRDDFETLSNLFEQYSTEAQKGIVDGMGEKPLERIVLYIDDLDRCEESRVLEVLEAVHLIMAFNLFVVVVGIDPSRVKSALTAQLCSKGQVMDHGVSFRYLEKIFQVPFHLIQPSDQAVKYMLSKLLTPVKASEQTAIDIPDQRAEIDISRNVREIMGGRGHNKSRTSLPKPAPIPLEKLLIEKSEIKRVSDFSALIGNNPRAVKRFVNILRIVRAHTSSVYKPYVTDLAHTEAIIFLLALSTGRYRPIYTLLTEYVKTNVESDLQNFITSVTDEKLQPLRDDLMQFLNQPGQLGLRETGLEIFAGHNKLISRFSFDELN